MKVSRKLEYARKAIDSILTHDDADLAVRNAAADALIKHIQQGKESAAARVQAKVDAELQPTSQAGE